MSDFQKRPESEPSLYPRHYSLGAESRGEGEVELSVKAERGPRRASGQTGPTASLVRKKSQPRKQHRGSEKHKQRDTTHERGWRKCITKYGRNGERETVHLGGVSLGLDHGARKANLKTEKTENSTTRAIGVGAPARPKESATATQRPGVAHAAASVHKHIHCNMQQKPINFCVQCRNSSTRLYLDDDVDIIARQWVRNQRPNSVSELIEHL